MRTSDICRVVLAIAGLGLGTALAFDGPGGPAVASLSAVAPDDGAPGTISADRSMTALQYAAEKGHAVAQWKLGHIYARGEGVPRDPVKAFRYFSEVANTHAEDSPLAPEARFIASAFVSLGRYYLDGIEPTIRPDADRAREMFRYAATYFGDGDAQYHLGKLYLDGRGVTKDSRQAARWLGLAARKGQHQAQAVLGSIFFNGDNVPRQAARGLMWLMLARDGAASDENWIADSYDSALGRASDDEREMALIYLRGWLKDRRD